MVNYLENHPKVVAVQPKILDYNRKEKFEHAGASGGFMDNWGYPFCRGRILETCEKDDGQYDTDLEIFWTSGAAMLVRNDVFKNLGGFDGDYFAHMEEIDWCWRAKRAGYQLMVLPQSKVYHVGGGTLHYDNPQKVYLNFRNALRTIFKNEPKSKLFWLLPWRLILDGLAGIQFLAKGKFGAIWAIVRAHWSFFFSIGKWMKKRKYYNQLVEEHRIGAANTTGHSSKSIIWQYFIKGNKTYDSITKS